jgi:hypothetical protein
MAKLSTQVMACRDLPCGKNSRSSFSYLGRAETVEAD